MYIYIYTHNRYHHSASDVHAGKEAASQGGPPRPLCCVALSCLIVYVCFMSFLFLSIVVVVVGYIYIYIYIYIVV